MSRCSRLEPVNPTAHPSPPAARPRPSSPPVALFDFDGVLVRGDSLVAFVCRCFLTRPWNLAVLVGLLPLLAWHLAASRPRQAWCAVVRAALLGLDSTGYEARVASFARSFARRARPDGIATLHMHRARGDRIIIVTGCEERLACAVLREMGLGDTEVLSSSIEPCRFGLHLAWHNTGTHKLVSLHRAGLTAWRTAYGDSIHDIPMLAVAEHPVLVNAGPRLFWHLVEAAPMRASRVAWQ